MSEDTYKKLLIAAAGLSTAIVLALSYFLQFKELELYLGAAFKDLNDFRIRMVLVTPKQKLEQKVEWFCGVKFF